MKQKNNITNVINLLDYDTEVKKSYKWENKWRTTFPVDLWISILMDYLYKSKSTNEIEEKYTLISQKLTKKSNNMYISVLLRKFYFPRTNKIDIKKINQFSEEEIENLIINHINFITKKHYKNSVPKAKKVINEWQKYINQNKDIDSWSNEKIIKKIKKIIENNKKRNFYYWEEISLKNLNYKKKVKQKKYEFKNQEINNEIKEKIGLLGEKIFYSALVNKFGYENVIHSSSIDKFSPYDFEVNFKNKKLFYEVKSTVKNSISFFLSRSEFDFANKIQKKHKYSLIFLKNINLKEESSLPIISEIKNPKFKINMNFIGVSNEKIFLIPSKFKGMI